MAQRNGRTTGWLQNGQVLAVNATRAESLALDRPLKKSSHYALSTLQALRLTRLASPGYPYAYPYAFTSLFPFPAQDSPDNGRTTPPPSADQACVLIVTNLVSLSEPCRVCQHARVGGLRGAGSETNRG
jgi:hypothetical protein